MKIEFEKKELFELNSRKSHLFKTSILDTFVGMTKRSMILEA